MATRLFWPPLSSKGDRSAISQANPTIAKASSTRSFTSPSGRPMLRGPKATSAKNRLFKELMLRILEHEAYLLPNLLQVRPPLPEVLTIYLHGALGRLDQAV